MGSDSARTVPLVDVPEDADVSVLSPSRRPAVLDLPEILSPFATESNCEDAMVKLGSLSCGQDPATVMLPVLVGVNSDGDGLLRKSFRESILGVADISVSHALGSLNSCAAFQATAIHAISGSVRVILLGAQAILADPLECSVHEPSIAAVVLDEPPLVAANKLLLRERNLFLVLQEVRALDSSCGRERPAAAARTLVFDWGHSRGLGPVHGVGSLHVSKVVHLVSFFTLGHAAEVHAREFLKGKVSELVLTKGEGAVTSVVGINVVHVPSEDGKARLEIIRSFKLDVVGLDVFGKVVPVLLKEGEVGRLCDTGSKGKEECKFHDLCVWAAKRVECEKGSNWEHKIQHAFHWSKNSSQ